jgi:hypothetical protein
LIVEIAFAEKGGRQADRARARNTRLHTRCALFMIEGGLMKRSRRTGTSMTLRKRSAKKPARKRKARKPGKKSVGKKVRRLLDTMAAPAGPRGDGDSEDK